MADMIWKKVLKAIDLQEIEVPEGAELLTAREQMDELCIWFRCEPGRRTVKRLIAIHGTGHVVTHDQSKYIGTGLLHGGQLVFHVFEVPIP